MSNGDDRFKVVITGGGVAGLEAAFALRELAGDAIKVTLLTPEERFAYRPLLVREPFGSAPARHYPVEQLARAAGAALISDTIKLLEPQARTVHTAKGRQLSYDALILALGARRYAQLPNVITINPTIIASQLERLVHGVEHGAIRRVSFVIPEGQAWPLPIYELALMLSAAARHAGADVAITVVTADNSPLEIFGSKVSTAVAELLESSGVRFLGGGAPFVRTPHWITRGGQFMRLYADEIVVLPELRGPMIPGVPRTVPGGFVAVDEHSQVEGLTHVFAAGDMTARPVKHGALAAQQADAAAEQIAVQAGLLEHAHPYLAVMHALLLGGDSPLYIRARMIGGVTIESEVSHEPLWEHPQKLHARYLAPALTHANPVLSL